MGGEIDFSRERRNSHENGKILMLTTTSLRDSSNVANINTLRFPAVESRASEVGVALLYAAVGAALGMLVAISAAHSSFPPHAPIAQPVFVQASSSPVVSGDTQIPSALQTPAI
jgi:hypothetical protein